MNVISKQGPASVAKAKWWVVLAAALATGASCGGSDSGLTTDSVTKCDETTCPLPRPAGLTLMCPDQSLAGPACIRHTDGTCGWANLTCPINRGPNGNGGAGGTIVGAAGRGVGPTVGSGGYPGSGAVTGSGGFGVGSGGFGVGSGGRYVGSGGNIGSGGFYTGTGGWIGSGGYIGSGGWDGGTGGYWGSGGFFGGSGGFFGSFSWSSQGASFSSPGYYDENTTVDNQSLTITISSDYSQFGIPCWIRGQFAAVPPPAGNYPIVDASAKQVDGTFVGGCSIEFREATVYADPSLTGMVTIGQAKPGLVEGSFAMHARPIYAGTGGAGGAAAGPMNVYTGAFSVGCLYNRPLTDPSCAMRMITK